MGRVQENEDQLVESHFIRGRFVLFDPAGWVGLYLVEVLDSEKAARYLLTEAVLDLECACLLRVNYRQLGCLLSCEVASADLLAFEPDSLANLLD